MTHNNQQVEVKKHPGGRPPFYNTPQELQEKIDDYFKTGLKTKTVIIGTGQNKRTVEIQVPTVSGLALFLGFMDRQSIYDYKGKDEFSCIIKRAITAIEQHYEELLQQGNVAGAIFWLKNHGWRDKMEVDHGITGDLAGLLKEIDGSSRGLPSERHTKQLTGPGMAIEQSVLHNGRTGEECTVQEEQ